MRDFAGFVLRLAICWVNLILPAVLSSYCFGESYYVSPTGSGTECGISTPCSLDYGVSTLNLQPGDVLILQPGTYTRSNSPILEITKGGSAGNYICYRASDYSGNGNVTRSRAVILSAGARTHGIRVHADYVRLQGIKVVGNDFGASGGAFNVGNEGYADPTRQFHDIIIEDCEVYHVKNSGFHNTTAAYNVEVRYCWVNGTGYGEWWGEAFYTGNKTDPALTIHDYKVHHNTIQDFTQNAFDVKKYAYNVEFYNNRAFDLRDCLSGDRPGVICSRQRNEGWIELSGHDNSAYNNICSRGKTGYGLVAIQGNSNNRIYNNVFTDMVSVTPACVAIKSINSDIAENGTDSYVYNNTFFNCLRSDIGDPDDTRFLVKNNIGIDYRDNVAASDVRAAWFVNPSAYDFHLASSAPGTVIDAAKVEPYSTTDLDGTPIFNGIRDRGAYEFTPGKPGSQTSAQSKPIAQTSATSFTGDE